MIVNEIIPYLEMCQREKLSLQKGMNFQVGDGYSIILVSVRKNAPYQDRFEDEGTTLIYEGHDVAKGGGNSNPKSIDQSAKLPSGRLTENGKFANAAQEYKMGKRLPEKVKVYEKIHNGIWSFDGMFDLVDSWMEENDGRKVFKFKLLAIKDSDINKLPTDIPIQDRRRIIPTSVKLEVWKRDDGKCVKCGSQDELHFDHIIPFSKGGTSIKAENVQLLCARHNLQKHDKIE